MKNTFFDFILKNRYVIICVSIVLVLLLTGILGFIIKVVAVLVLFMLAVYIGRRIQEDNDYIKKAFDIGKEKITYTVKDEEDEENKE